MNKEKLKKQMTLGRRTKYIIAGGLEIHSESFTCSF